MLESIRIENYKSIEELDLPLGRINVFIGENGAGKSNILEAIALAGAAQARKLDNEFLASRGIRVSGPQLMRSAFNAGKASQPIKVSVKTTAGDAFDYELTNDNEPYSTWQSSSSGDINSDVFTELSKRRILSMSRDERIKFAEKLRDQVEKLGDQLNSAIDQGPSQDRKITNQLKEFFVDMSMIDTGGIEDFIIYAPENSALRSFEREGQIEPLGINGEGLLKLLGVMSSAKDKEAINSIKESLTLFSWFEDFKIASGQSGDRIEIFDQFLDETGRSFDQRSASEGFLFLAFYLALFTSELTPRFFAVDNIDSSLNPKLCEALMRRLATLAKDHGKQVLITTHNPAVLDGLDLGNPAHRLFIISRGSDGQTGVRHFERKPSDGKLRRLSELFMSGALGGLPKGF